MKTDELISLLATQIEPVDSRRLRRKDRVALAGGCLASLVICAAVLKINPTLSHIVVEPMFWVREFFCVTLGVTGILAVTRLGSPGRRMGFLPFGFLLPVLVLWSLAAVALLSSPSHERISLILGRTARACPFLIVLLAAPLLIAFIGILRGRAPTHLRTTGAAAGFAAGSLGAVAYTLHCPELAAPFIGVWYLSGILLSAALGALIGTRLLRW
jgi:hypothetical protein